MNHPVPASREDLALPNPDEFDIVRELLRSKRSTATQREYSKDLRKFFAAALNSSPTPLTVQHFLSLSQPEAVALVLKYKNDLIARSLTPSTVNRRLTAIRSLVRVATAIGRCSFSLDAIEGERVQRYRDTSGITRQEFQGVIAACDRSTMSGLRDYAILRLLWDNALRRNEICGCDVSDFDPNTPCLWIKGKGRALKERIDLGKKATAAIESYLRAKPGVNPQAPLFTSLSFASIGERLTGEAIRLLVAHYCEAAGIAKPMSPHRLRHSSITAALDATGGDVRSVQRLSRHKHLDTLMIYDDNRRHVQLSISELLEDMAD